MKIFVSFLILMNFLQFSSFVDMYIKILKINENQAFLAGEFKKLEPLQKIINEGGCK